MKCSTIAGAVLLGATLVATASTGVTAQVRAGPTPGPRLVTGRSGAVLVLAGTPATSSVRRQVKVGAAVQFKPLAWADKVQLLQQAGMPAPAQPPADEGFTVTPRAPWVEGRGYYATALGSHDPYFNVAMASDYDTQPQEIILQAANSWLQTHRNLLVHFNVMGSASKKFTVHNYVDKSYTEIPGTNIGQDIVLYIQLPAGNLSGDRTLLATISMAPGSYWEFRGAQVTPLP